MTLQSTLEFFGFIPAQAAYGVEYCNADWYDEALRMAKGYLDYYAISAYKMSNMLTSEDGFTGDEANYAVANCGGDWAFEALEWTNTYIQYGSTSTPYELQALVLDRKSVV